MKKRHLHRHNALDQLFSTRDQPATEPFPPRSDVHEYVLSANEETLSCKSVGQQIHLRATGDLKFVHPVAREEKTLMINELVRAVEGVRTPEAFRPKWLDVMTAPRIYPRYLDINLPSGGLRPLVFESPGTEWPWCAIGKLFVTRSSGSTMVGSGVMVGPNLLLTASHAMPWGTDDSSIRFVPNYRNGNDPRFGEAFVSNWRGVRNEDDVTGLDYVICKLNWRIGDRTGWLGSEWHSNEDWYYDDPWISVGYPTSEPNGGERPSIEIPIWVQDIDNESDGLEIETHKFALGGWSGGPLWGWRGGQPRVVGIESGFEKDFLDPTRTVFGGGQHLVNLVKFGWDNWT